MILGFNSIVSTETSIHLEKMVHNGEGNS